MIAKGRTVIETLATRFPQLYVAPAEGAQDAHRLAAGRGLAPENANLEHFTSNEEDELREVETPAGPIEVVFLKERRDFETILQILGHKSQPDPIARTVGAITYRGLPDWGKVEKAYRDYVDSGGENWADEFQRLAKQPGAFRCELVIISEGPYSNVSASETGYSPDSWLRISREIRLHHECAHVVCRRMMPADILPIWDEITADVVGLICATQRYDAKLAMRFLGVGEHGYENGRLEEYLNDSQSAQIDDIAVKVADACMRIEAETTSESLQQPFDFLLKLKAAPLLDC